jgi:hypothetical protein
MIITIKEYEIILTVLRDMGAFCSERIRRSPQVPVRSLSYIAFLALLVCEVEF